MAGYKRFGIDQGNIDLERRLRTIEQSIKLKADANAATDVSSQSRLVPLAVENVSITGGTQSWRLEWNSVTAPDLKQYIIQVSETSTFEAFENYDVDNPYFEYTVQPGVTDVVNYARVRAVTNLGYEGPWSSIFDIASGKLVSSDFEQGATTGFVQWSQTSFDADLMSNTVGQNPYGWPPGEPPQISGIPEPTTTTGITCGPVYYTAVDGGVIFPYVTFDFSYQTRFAYPKSSGTSDTTNALMNRLRMVLYRRPTGGADSTVGSADTQFLVSLPQSPAWDWRSDHETWRYIDVMRTRFFFPLLPDTPGIGDWEYRVGISVLASEATCGIYVKPTTLKVVLFEFRR